MFVETPSSTFKGPLWAKSALPFVLALVTLRKLRPSLTLFATLFLEHAGPENNPL